MITLSNSQAEKHLAETRVLLLRSNPPEIMNAFELADYMNLHVDTIRALFAQGALPGRKVGTRLLFYRDSIREWFKKKETKVG